jgi:hypothetical protein
MKRRIIHFVPHPQKCMTLITLDDVTTLCALIQELNTTYQGYTELTALCAQSPTYARLVPVLEAMNQRARTALGSFGRIEIDLSQSAYRELLAEAHPRQEEGGAL